MKTTIESIKGKVEVKAVETDTPGLVITDTPMLSGKTKFTITHQSSGLAIGPAFKTVKQATRLVRALDGLTDWTQSDAELSDVPGLQQRAADAVKGVQHG